eukprot:TRINITY_DN1205_c0_g1_i5.p2 TRINITY_DN1205_c0_g1~~TRINITY_DN1205_c0_g1_i5.p2  ORF type:complete len:116 (-),score=24.24 TRINITY_DN1205_c0_g1_i5:299-646(-)
MKALLFALAAFVCLVVVAAQTPALPTFPSQFSASVIVRGDRDPRPRFHRWFYDANLNADRLDGLFDLNGAEWWGTTIFDHKANRQYNAFFQQDVVLCFYHELNRTIPRPSCLPLD